MFDMIINPILDLSLLALSQLYLLTFYYASVLSFLRFDLPNDLL